MPDGNKPKILIADDTVAIADVFKMKLETSGFSAAVAKDGNEVLKALETETFDLILLDLMMPNLDGFGVLEAMQQKGIKIPVIVTSNLGQPEDVERVKKLGAVDYFLKADVPLSEMVERIKKILKV
ncbi:MAG: two-component system, OmpR family, response regulator [Patescibacteria group bacterium]|jgi:CheY-like chemotaxis protein|nr:two-component system, OmpR family, response regulator [Patescibacteria group bacterium]